MLTQFFSWFILDNEARYTLNNKIAVLLITLICALCFDVLTPRLEAALHLEDLEIASYSAAVAAGNKFNQIFWIFTTALALMSILRDPIRYRQVIFSQWPLVLLAVLACTSIFWALNSTISFRRSILLLFIFTSVSAGITFLRSPNQLLLILYRVCCIALVLNLFTLITGNFDSQGYFYGMHGQKNSLGAVALIAIYFSLFARNLYPDGISKRLNSFVVAIWIVLMLLSVSKTSIALCISVPILMFTAHVASRSIKLNLGVMLLLVTLVSVLLVSAVLSLQNWHIKDFLGQFMSDPGFTGRDYIWNFLLERIEQRWLLGHGYGSFWGIGAASPNVVYGQSYLQLLNQGHNGYLDLLAILGISGLIIYFLVLAVFVKQAGEIQSSHPKLFFLLWMLLILTMLHNITESSLMRGSHSMWIVQLFAITMTARLATDRRILSCQH